MDEEMKRLVQEEMKRDAKRIMEEVENDLEVAHIKATPEMREKIFEQIRKMDQEKEIYQNLPEEYKELVDMGRTYKKRRKNRKYMVLAASLVLSMAVGITGIGGPERLFKEIQWEIGGREQVNVDSDSERVVEPQESKEEEAYQEIQDKFGFEPVRMDYLPEGMEFTKAIISEEIKTSQFCYYGKDKESIIYRIRVNYNQGSVGFDVEDQLVDKFIINHNETEIEAKQYFVKETDHKRWIIRFEYQNIQYFITINNVKRAEIEKILKNLYFL